MAGLLAARVLSDFYQTVTLIERDRLADAVVQRKGIPQGRHLHSLLSRGSLALDELFPGLLDELLAAGVNVLDDGDLSRVYIRFGSYRFNRSEKFTDPASLVQYLPSRPVLEFHVRGRVRALGNVSFLDNHDAVEPIADSSERIVGVRVVNRGIGKETAFHADLVVDAMGRAARTPSFLENLGYGRPAEERSAANGTYYSQLVSIPPGMIAEKLVLASGGKESAAGGLVAYEHGTWILTVTHLGAAGEPPTDLAGMRALAEQFTPPSMVAGLRSAEPLGDVAVFRYPGGVWRRYDRMPRLPVGLLVIGDALCTLNPVWGQGMTMAALEALALHDCLLGGKADVAGRFFRGAARHIGPTWALNQARDRTLSPARGRRSMSRRLTNWTMNKAFEAAENDIMLTERFTRVNNLIDPPTRLQDPMLMARAVLRTFKRRPVERRLLRDQN
jgi:2-polyprenyl-6-methoxyphenol hydroxylase-like FAD-dependent oxidoreductase